MANTKQSGSAAQRREQERQQRQRRDDSRLSARNRGQGPIIRRQDRSQLYMIIGALALIGAFIGLFIYLRSSSSAPAPAAPANQAIVQQVTGVNQTTWQKIGTGGLNNPFKS